MAGRTHRKPPEVPARRALEFTRARPEYTVSEFEHLYGSCLPTIVMVTRGGHAEDRSLPKDQVITLQCVSRQLRVVARAINWGYPELYSISDCVRQDFHFVDQDGQASDKVESLYHLLSTRKLPFRVKFPRGHVLKNENAANGASEWPHLELMYTFEETHVLSNLIQYDKALEDIIYISLHDSTLRFSMITGIEGVSPDAFKRFREEIDRSCMSNEYDMQYGRMEVAVYEIHDLQGRLVPKLTRCSRPVRFTDFAKIFDRPRLEEPAECPFYDYPLQGLEQDDEYETLRFDRTPSMMIDSEKVKHAGPALPPIGDRGHAMSPADDKPTRTGPKPPPVAPKPKHYKRIPAKAGDNASATDYMNNIPRGSVSPFVSNASEPKTTKHTDIQRQLPLPTNTSKHIDPVQLSPKTEKQTLSVASSKTNSQHINAVPGTPVGPMDANDEACAKQKSDQINNTYLTMDTNDATCARQTSDEIDITKLTIDEVCEYLIRLHLGHYADTFREEMVDGTILQELDEAFLESEFGLKPIETIRLMKFVKEGHVPH